MVIWTHDGGAVTSKNAYIELACLVSKLGQIDLPAPALLGLDQRAALPQTQAANHTHLGTCMHGTVEVNLAGLCSSAADIEFAPPF